MKLPKYIQELLYEKERRIEELERDIGFLQKEENKPTDLYYSPTHDLNIYIPADSLITFNTRGWEISMYFTEGKKSVTVRSDRHPLLVQPCVSNVVEVKCW